MRALRNDPKGGIPVETLRFTTLARRSRSVFAACAIALLPALGGCLSDYVAADRTDRTPRELTLAHQSGGVHHRGLLHGGTWYVSQGNTVLALDPRSGKSRGEERVLPNGTCGAIVDMIVWRGDLFVVLDESAIARLDIRSSKTPATVEVLDADALGLLPKELSVVDDALYVSGKGGVMRLDTRRRFLTDKARVGHVAPSQHGPVAVVERQVVSLENGEYVGAASFIDAIPSSLGIEGGLVFALQTREGASVGIMGPDVREISSDSVTGWLRRVRVLDGRLWAVTDTELVCWDISRAKLEKAETFKLKGGFDIDAINDNYFAVVGSFGRAVLRMHDDSTGQGDEFLRVTRVPGRLDVAISDQINVVGSSPEGTWSYRGGGRPALTERKSDVWSIPAKEVSAVWGTARLVADGDTYSAVEITGGGASGQWTPQNDARVFVMSVIDGDLWVGHDRGISVLRHRTAAGVGPGSFPVAPHTPIGKSTPTCPLVEIGAIVWEGPVFLISALRTGQGALFVSHWGGFGVAEWVLPKKKKDDAVPRRSSRDASESADRGSSRSTSVDTPDR